MDSVDIIIEDIKLILIELGVHISDIKFLEIKFYIIMGDRVKIDNIIKDIIGIKGIK